MANPPPPYSDITGISRAVMKDNAQVPLQTYDGVARPGELVANLEVDPPSLYIGNSAGQLSLVSSGAGITYGCFHKVANVTAPAADTVYNFDWYTDVSPHISTNGVTVTSSDPTHINIDQAGVYNVFVEMQIKNTLNANRETYLWLAKNGTDIDETCVKVEIKQGGGTDAYQLLNKQWIVDDIAANDYLQLRFAVNNVTGISLEYTASQTIPYLRPAIPSAVITITPALA